MEMVYVDNSLRPVIRRSRSQYVLFSGETEGLDVGFFTIILTTGYFVRNINL